ncbi:hypothetical protein VCHA50O413_110042 [Vibrio chagasii]|nr:hypothetical protein VCHA27O13_10045 [Vibrio chagasii]CAH6829666.1 hypothetical protein VCHA32P90_10047 [Vibrio chagasii]CAH6833180.1 hypothetical protein VCHA35O135_180043 [Vibrio chagasii]CAH6834191.1 hypothetical protein VCHA34P116_10047 [Vibrio chagasii]CAH6867391.1 hypothetical protein VCHA35O137_11080 [Vibrio chagasii]
MTTLLYIVLSIATIFFIFVIVKYILNLFTFDFSDIEF